MATHTYNTGHSFNFEKPNILKFERNKLKLQIQEVNQIMKFEDKVCNFKTDKKDYSNTYYNLITHENGKQN